MKFFNFLMKTRKAKEIPTLTDFLVNNPFFRKWVLASHKAKSEAINSVDDYLEKELLGKNQEPKRKIETRSKNNNR